jgi:hypothetical protein
MSELTVVRDEPTCPFLRSPESDADVPTPECRAGPQPLTLPPGHETRHCRGGGHTACPRWLAASTTRRLPAPPRPALAAPRPALVLPSFPVPAVVARLAPLRERARRWKGRLRRSREGGRPAAFHRAVAFWRPVSRPLRLSRARARRFGRRAVLGAAAGLAVAAVALLARPAVHALTNPPAPPIAYQRPSWSPQSATARETPRDESRPRPPLLSEPAPTAAPAGTPAPSPTPGPRLEVRLADPRPHPFGEQTIFARLSAADRPVAAAPCRLDIHYRTETVTWRRQTAPDGTVELTLDLNGATPLYPVKVDMECVAEDRPARATAQFVPGG